MRSSGGSVDRQEGVGIEDMAFECVWIVGGRKGRL